jgi:hypothetical protein
VPSGSCLHGGDDLGLARQAVALELGDGGARLAQHMAVRGQDELHAVFGAGCVEPVERVEVVGHVAVGRVDDGRAAVEDVVAAEQQAVFPQQQAQVVGRVARRVHHLQGMGDFAVQPFSSQREQLIIR